jgi:hypothetical protein
MTPQINDRLTLAMIMVISLRYWAR